MSKDHWIEFVSNVTEQWHCNDDKVESRVVRKRACFWHQGQMFSHLSQAQLLSRLSTTTVTAELRTAPREARDSHLVTFLSYRCAELCTAIDIIHPLLDTEMTIFGVSLGDCCERDLNLETPGYGTSELEFCRWSKLAHSCSMSGTDSPCASVAGCQWSLEVAFDSPVAYQVPDLSPPFLS